MPPKQSTAARASAAAAAAAGLSKSKSKSKPAASSSRTAARAPAQKPASRTAAASSLEDLSDFDPFADDVPLEEEQARPRPQQPKRRRQEQAAATTSMDLDDDYDNDQEAAVDDDEEAPKTIPPDLLTRLLHEFFEKEGTRISRDANAAAAKYVDVFVREAIARTAVEKESGFLDVEDLEKIAPQLLLDL